MVYNKQVIDSVRVTQPCPVLLGLSSCKKDEEIQGNKLQCDSLATCSHGPSGIEISQASRDTVSGFFIFHWLLHVQWDIQGKWHAKIMIELPLTPL